MKVIHPTEAGSDNTYCESSCLWATRVVEYADGLGRERRTLEKVLSLSCSVVEHGSTHNRSV